MKTYKVIKSFKNDINLEITEWSIVNYDLDCYVKLLINNWFIEEVEKVLDNVEKFIYKICEKYNCTVDTQNYKKTFIYDILANNIKDNWKEEIKIALLNRFYFYNEIFNELLDNYLIIKL